MFQTSIPRKKDSNEDLEIDSNDEKRLNEKAQKENLDFKKMREQEKLIQEKKNLDVKNEEELLAKKAKQEERRSL